MIIFHFFVKFNKFSYEQLRRFILQKVKLMYVSIFVFLVYRKASDVSGNIKLNIKFRKSSIKVRIQHKTDVYMYIHTLQII